jgi:hypothetical protein
MFRFNLFRTKYTAACLQYGTLGSVATWFGSGNQNLIFFPSAIHIWIALIECIDYLLRTIFTVK